jgi:hypothetical protein
MISSRKSLLLASGFAVALGGSANGAITSILLTSDDLGLGSSKINHDKNGKAIEDDRIGKLVTSSADNVGSILSIQTDNLAGPGTALEPLLATVTARTHLDIVNNLPLGGHSLYAGAITLTNDSGDIEKDGLGVRTFGIDLDPLSPDYARRYKNPAYVNLTGNPNGYQMEGSKEVSGGVNNSDFEAWILGQPAVPGNEPPHVDEEVIFDINDAALIVPADSVNVLITKIKAGADDLFDVAVDVTITMVGGEVISNSYIPSVGSFPGIFSQPDPTKDYLNIDFSGIAGVDPGDLVDSFVIGARDDPADPENGTDEHFLIHGFTVDIVPEPAAFTLLATGMGLVFGRRRS